MALDHQYPHRFTTDDAAGLDWNVLGPKLLEALELFMDRMDRFGEWDEHCFYYQRVRAPEFHEPMSKAYTVIAEAEGR